MTNKQLAKRLIKIANVLIAEATRIGTWQRNFETIDQIHEPLQRGCNHSKCDHNSEGTCPGCGKLLTKQDQSFLQPNRLDDNQTGARRRVDLPDRLRTNPELIDIIKETYNGPGR